MSLPDVRARLWRACLRLLVLVALASCANRTDGSALPQGTLRILTGEREVRLQVEIADTEEARVRGLSGRERLAEDAGMVFLFPEPSRAGFWMKDTKIPLSIAFWGEDGRIVDIIDMTPCRTVICPVYRPQASYVGAVEVNRGVFDQLGVQVGDRVALEGYRPSRAGSVAP